jgi:hypothetical protein
MEFVPHRIEFVAHGFHIPQIEFHVPQIQLYVPQNLWHMSSCTTKFVAHESTKTIYHKNIYLGDL